MKQQSEAELFEWEERHADGSCGGYPCPMCHEAATRNRLDGEPLDLMLTKIENQGSLILMVCRDVAGERYVVQVPFRHYFYAPDDEAAQRWKQTMEKEKLLDEFAIQQVVSNWNDLARKKYPDALAGFEMGYRAAVDGRSLTRVYVNNPQDVGRKRRGLTALEADVEPRRRFLIDTGIKKGLRLKRYDVVNAENRVLRALPEDIEAADVDAPMKGILYDIETNRGPNGKYSQPVHAEGAVTAITYNECVWTSQGVALGEVVTTLQWHPSHKQHGKPRFEAREKYSHAFDTEIEWHVYTYSSEAELLLEFVRRLKKTPPDVMSAWNGHYGFKTKRAPGGTGGYDAPYLINRLDRVGIGSAQLSPFNHTYANYRKGGQMSIWKCEIGGVQLVDMMTTYTIKDGGMTGSVPFSGLKAVVESKTDMPILKDPNAIEEWWEYNNDAFLDYSFQDVDALMLLERKEDYVGYIKRFQWATGVEDANCLFAPSTMIDSLVLRKARQLGVVLPSGGSDDGDIEHHELPERGGYVLPPRKQGVLKNVAVLDVSAMYVAIMQSCNVGRDTLVLPHMDKRDDDIVVPLVDDWSKTVRFRSPDYKLGVIPQMLDELRQLRKVYDDQIKVATTPAEVKKLKKEREPAKQLLLTTYGVQLNPFFRLAHEWAGAAIPAAGRFLIKSAIRHSDRIETPYTYADTDSGLAEAPEHMDGVSFGHWLEKQMVKAFNAAAREMNLKAHTFEMGFEKLYSSFVMGRTKKRYAGLVVWSEGVYAEEPFFDFAGIEAAKHDWPAITKETEKKVLRGLLDGVPQERLLAYVRSVYDLVRHGEVEVQEVVKAQRLGFDIERDLDTNTDIVRGARNARDLFDFQYKVGERVYVLKLKGTTDVISVPEGKDIPTSQLKIDWEHHAEAAVLKPLKAIFEWVGGEDEFASIALGTKPTKQTRLVFEVPS